MNEKFTNHPLQRIPDWILRPIKIISIFLLAFFLMLFFPWQQFTVGRGKLVALDPNQRLQEIHAPVNGLIKEWHVVEGSQIKKGDLLVELSDTDPQNLTRLESEKVAALRAQEAAQLALETSKFNLRRQRDLFKQGLASRKDYENSKINVSKYEVELAKAQTQYIKAQRELARQLTQKIVAPVDGFVVRVKAGVGAQIVKSGDPLMVIAPKINSLVAELWVSGDDIALIEAGDKARIQFAGWPAVQVPGWPSIAVGTFQGKVHLVDAAASMKGKFRVLITPEENWPSQLFIRQGSSVSGFINIGTVPLWWEIWRQVNGFPAETTDIEDELRNMLNQSSTYKKKK